MKDYSKIPEELKNMNQWVCAWDNSKIPMKAFEESRFLYCPGYMEFL